MDRRSIELDVDELRRDVLDGRNVAKWAGFSFNLDKLLARYEGISDNLDAWINDTRSRFDDQLKDAFSRAMDDVVHEESARSAAARALLAMDPSSEPACRFLMKLFVKSGDVAAAIRLYKTLRNFVKESLGAELSEKTDRLIEEINVATICQPSPIAGHSW